MAQDVTPDSRASKDGWFGPAEQESRSFALGPLCGGGLWATGIVVAGYLVIALQQASQPYVIDEATFPYGSEGILREGAPYFYNGETRPNDLGAWHPPLYIYALAIHMLAFGSSHVSVRLFGMVMAIAAAAVIMLVARIAAPHMPQCGYAAIAALVLWNPLILSGSLVPDIDGSVGLLATALILWIAVRLILQPASRRLLLEATLIVAMAFATKLTLALLFLPLLVGAAVLSSNERARRLALVAGAGVAGFVAFLFGYWALSKAAGFPFNAPFDYFMSGLQRTQGQSGVGQKLASSLAPTGGVLYFLTPGLLIGATVGTVVTFMAPSPRVSRRSTLLLFAAGLYLILSYAMITGSPYTFPKYWGVAVLPLAVTASLILCNRQVSRDLSALKTLNRGLLVVLVAACAIIPVGWGYAHLNAALTQGSRDLTTLAIIGVAAFATCFVALIAIRPLTQRNRSTPLLSGLAAYSMIALLFGIIGSQMTVNLVHRSADFSTRYYFGERGLASVVDYLSRETPKDSYIIGAKDIGLQSGRRFYEDAALLPQSPDDLRSLLANNPADYFVTRKKWDYSDQVYPDQFAVLPEFFTPIADQPAEDFTIWRRNG